MPDAKRFLAILLCIAVILIPIPMTVSAEENILIISNAEEWCKFAENCRLDSYSANLCVQLKNDIDMSDRKNFCVPYFNGSFDGENHRIYGIQAENSEGIFRVIGENGKITELNCEAEINADELENAGILCGINKGTIEKCTVSGNIQAEMKAGAIAGFNDENAVITGCISNAVVKGTSKMGGIVGVNSGLIENSQNTNAVNTEANEDATYIGGICGYNEGIILNCKNTADVGYSHTGYYIGGIVGLSKGYVGDSVNSGMINGRRNAGGIAGLMEPHYRLEFGENSMALLSNDTDDLIGKLNTAVESLETASDSGVTGVNDTVSQVRDFQYWLELQRAILSGDTAWIDNTQMYLDEIRNELDELENQLPNEPDVTNQIDTIRNLLDSFDPKKPSEWYSLTQELSTAFSELTIILEQSAQEQYAFLTDTLSRLSQSIYDVMSEVTNGFYSFGEKSVGILNEASDNLTDIIQNTEQEAVDFYDDATEFDSSLNDALDSLEEVKTSIDRVLNGKENVVTDLSDEADAKENGMIVSCQNSGNILADYSAGGIVGNISTEISLDREAEPLLTADEVLFTDTTTFVRATIYHCFNTAEIDAKYNYSGGIAGYSSAGMIMDCLNSGNISAGKNDSGGIAGLFSGSVLSCRSIGKISGKSYVGGIAGSAVNVRQCDAITAISEDAMTLFGAVAGEITGTAEENTFICDSTGGINGISYQGIAEPIEYTALIEHENTDIFRNVTVSFETDDGHLTDIIVPYNGAVSDLPVVDEKEDQYWFWETFDEKHICYNMTVHGEWKNKITTLHTDEVIPVFLVEGSFNNTDILSVTPDTALQSDIPNTITANRIDVTNEKNKILTIRYLTEADGILYLLNNNVQQETEYVRDGKYIVFRLENGGKFLYAENIAPKTDDRKYVLVALGICGVLFISIIAVRKRKRYHYGK